MGRVLGSISPHWSCSEASLARPRVMGQLSLHSSVCYVCKGQNLHLEELVIKTQQEQMTARIADRLCGQGEGGWQVRTCSSGDCCALFPPSWLSSMIKEQILVIPAVVHVLKLFGTLKSKPTSSCIFLTCSMCVRGEALQHILPTYKRLCVEVMHIALVKTLSHKSSWLHLCNGSQVVAQSLLL